MSSLQGEVRKCAQESVQGTNFFDPTQTSDLGPFFLFYSAFILQESKERKGSLKIKSSRFLETSEAHC